MLLIGKTLRIIRLVPFSESLITMSLAGKDKIILFRNVKETSNFRNTRYKCLACQRPSIFLYFTLSIFLARIFISSLVIKPWHLWKGEVGWTYLFHCNQTCKVPTFVPSTKSHSLKIWSRYHVRLLNYEVIYWLAHGPRKSQDICDRSELEWAFFLA